MAQIAPKLFLKDLQKQIFPDNVFYTKAMKDVAAGNVTSVDIPLSGDLSSASSGTPSLPLSIGTRTDNVKNYSITQVWCEPLLVTREEDIVLSYSKQQDITNAQGSAISTECGNIAANAWGPTAAANLIASTGSARATELVGATGNRKALAKADLLNVRKAFMKQNIDVTGTLYGVVTPQQYHDLLGIAEFVDYEKTGVTSKLEKGIIGRILGFDIMVRWDAALGSIGLHYDATAANKKDNGTVAATDTPAALFFAPNYVRYAEGTVTVAINRNAPGYAGGTIIETITRFGASPSRTDEKGIVAIYEAT